MSKNLISVIFDNFFGIGYITEIQSKSKSLGFIPFDVAVKRCEKLSLRNKEVHVLADSEFGSHVFAEPYEKAQEKKMKDMKTKLH